VQEPQKPPEKSIKKVISVYWAIQAAWKWFSGPRSPNNSKEAQGNSQLKIAPTATELTSIEIPTASTEVQKPQK
jgi:hypothetical protein